MGVLGWWLVSWIVLAGASVAWIAMKPEYETPGMKKVRGFGTKAGFFPCFTLSLVLFVVSLIIYFVMKGSSTKAGPVQLPTSFSFNSAASAGRPTPPTSNPFGTASAQPPADPPSGTDEGPKPGNSANPFL